MLLVKDERQDQEQPMNDSITNKSIFDFDQAAYDEGFIAAQAEQIDDERWSSDMSYAEGVDDALDLHYISKYKDN